jgi:hypothetical protein
MAYQTSHRARYYSWCAAGHREQGRRTDPVPLTFAQVTLSEADARHRWPRDRVTLFVTAAERVCELEPRQSHTLSLLPAQQVAATDRIDWWLGWDSNPRSRHYERTNGISGPLISITCRVASVAQLARLSTAEHHRVTQKSREPTVSLEIAQRISIAG